MRTPDGLPELVSDRDTVQIRRRVRFVRDGLVGMSEEITVPDEHRAVIATGPFWFFALVERDAGEIGAGRPDGTVWVPHDRFCRLLPPFSVVELLFRKFHCTSAGVFCDGPLPHEAGERPVLFAAPDGPCPETAAEVAAFVGAAAELIPIERAPTPSALGRRSKEALDRAFDTDRPLAEAAAGLRITAAQFSRAFRADYGIPPRVYRHRMRVLSAIIKLLRGEQIARVGMEVGFGDLSRFYKQFRAVTRTTPGTYAAE
jgi:AraC-like DNA-binding protein